MDPADILHQRRDDVKRVVAAHRASNPRVFGSVASGAARGDSDVDLLVDPTPETTLMDIGAIRHALQQLLGVPVDVVTPGALPLAFREEVLGRARPL
jgi:predicted nucleotidyltransferase